MTGAQTGNGVDTENKLRGGTLHMPTEYQRHVRRTRTEGQSAMIEALDGEKEKDQVGN